LFKLRKTLQNGLEQMEKARSEANALTLKDKKGHGEDEEETQSFLTAADGLTKTAGKSMNISYHSYKSLETSNKVSAKIDKAAKDLKDRDHGAKKKEIEEVQKQQQQFLADKAKHDAESNAARQYMIAITTSKMPGAGTDCAIGLVISGTKGKTACIVLPDEDKARFEAGKTDRFELEVDGDIGDITEITLGLDTDSSRELVIDWRVGDVELLDKAQGKRFVFPECENAVLGRPPFQKKEKVFKATERKQQ